MTDDFWDEFEGFPVGPESFQDGYGRVWTVHLTEPAARELTVGLLDLAASDPSELARLFDPWKLSEILPSYVSSPGRGRGCFNEDLTLSLRNVNVAKDAAQAVACALIDITSDAQKRAGIMEALKIAGFGSHSPFEGVSS